ncbi:MAG: heme o synthase [Candidatus Geothermarchaeales archaeon]
MRVSTIRAYWDLTKPRVVLLLVYTSLASYLLASRIHGAEFFYATLLVSMAAITVGSAGCNSVTGYFDRDIDGVMRRTKHRPLPSRRIYPPERGLYFGLALLALACVLSITINLVAFLVMLLGILDNVVIYSFWLKRRNPINIILGGLSGGMPALFGWVSASNGQMDLTPILLGAAVVAWIPNHIWNLVLYHKTDYVSAGVPMLPVVVKEATAVRCIASTVPILFLITVFLGVVGRFGAVYWSVTVAFGLIILAGNVYTMFKPSQGNLWRMFKLSSPYLAIIFTSMLLDVYL